VRAVFRSMVVCGAKFKKVLMGTYTTLLPAVYHLGCIEPPLKKDDGPPDDCKCPICMKHQVRKI